MSLGCGPDYKGEEIMNALKKAVRYISKVELIVCAVTFAIMVACYFISVVNRNFIKTSMPWTEEIGLYCIVYMALIGMEIGLRDGTQVSVTALTDKLKGTRTGKVLDLISNAILIVFVFMMLRYGISLVARQMQTGQTTPVMKIPMYAMYLSLVISFGITLVTQLMIFMGKICSISMNEITDVDSMIEDFSVGKGD